MNKNIAERQRENLNETLGFLNNIITETYSNSLMPSKSNFSLLLKLYYQRQKRMMLNKYYRLFMLSCNLCLSLFEGWERIIEIYRRGFHWKRKLGSKKKTAWVSWKKFQCVKLKTSLSRANGLQYFRIEHGNYSACVGAQSLYIIDIVIKAIFIFIFLVIIHKRKKRGKYGEKSTYFVIKKASVHECYLTNRRFSSLSLRFMEAHVLRFDSTHYESIKKNIFVNESSPPSESFPSLVFFLLACVCCWFLKIYTWKQFCASFWKSFFVVVAGWVVSLLALCCQTKQLCLQCQEKKY